MGMFDIEYSFDNLLRTTAAGLEISNFVQVKDAITKRYKEVYGNDIDVDSTTGDGQFIMMLALMLFNGYSGLYYLNQNLDPASATNTFLDRLCSFNNVFRKTAEPSYAFLYVKYVGQIDNYHPIQDNTEVQEITCMDKSGNLWKWQEGKALSDFPHTFNRNDGIYLLKFTCQEAGAIDAKAEAEIKDLDPNTITEEQLGNYHGEISQVIDKSVFPFEVWQAKDAVVGRDDETDVALRARRVYELGNNGVTVLNGIRGSLVEIEGVVESKIYTNVIKPTSNTFETNDGSDVEYHDVYICIRYRKGVTPDETLIGQTIYNKMTPGIVTAPLNKGYDEETPKYIKYNDSTNVSKFGEERSYEVNIYQGILRDRIYWKKCEGINPAIQLKFMFNKNLYQKGSVVEDKYVYSDIENTIIETIKKSAFNLTIFDDLNVPNLMGNINSASPVQNGQTTFIFIDGKVRKKFTNPETGVYDYSTDIIEDITSNELDTYFENCDTYYDYSDSTFTFNYPSEPPTTDYIIATLDIYETSN